MKQWFIGEERRYIVIAPQSIVFFFGLILLGWFVFSIFSILVMLFLAFILMIAMRPVVNNLRKFLKLPRPLAIFTAYGLFIAVVVGVFGLLIPPLVTEAQALAKVLDVPFFVRDVDIAAYFTEFNFSLEDVPSLLERAGDSVSLLMGVVNSAISIVFSWITVVVMSLFLLFEHDTLYQKVRWFTASKEKIDQAKEFMEDIETQLGGWVRAQVLLMGIIGMVNYIGLTLLSIPYALPLALVAGLLEVVPNLGPTLAALVACSVALITKGPLFALATLVLAIVIQQVENNILVPKVMQANAHVNPLVSLVSILTGFTLAGVVGGFMAIPLYIICRAIYSSFIRPT